MSGTFPIGREPRVGIGVDAHALVEGVPLVLGGVEFPDESAGLAGHTSDSAGATALLPPSASATKLKRSSPGRQVGQNAI